MKPVFLTAHWRALAMINFVIDPAVLAPRLPRGLELDFFQGETFVSLVGFRFERTRLLGIPVPGHVNFDEVNLRFYVRRQAGGDWRRGVVFIKELVPRWAIAFLARYCYGEPYEAVRMTHMIQQGVEGMRARYSWQGAASEEFIEVRAWAGAQALAPGSQEEFIAEHYWGYTGRPGGLQEYEVQHPPWQVHAGIAPELKLDVARLYGAEFVPVLSARPTSCFVAVGSDVVVRQPCFVPVK